MTNDTNHKEIYILDTNVLVYDPQSLLSFPEKLVAISVISLEELDKFKSESTQRGYNCRSVIRKLDSLRSKGSLLDGVKLENGSTFKILFEVSDPNCKIPFSDEILDNKILLGALCQKQKGFRVKFISKDINVRVKADILGIEAFDYTKDKVTKDEFYRGWRIIQASAVQLKKDLPDELLELHKAKELLLNEFIILESRHNPFNYQIFRYLGENGLFKRVENPKLKWHLEPKNAHQLMALDLLLDDSIQLVSLVGPAGTGKTFLALLSGLHKVLIEHEYEKMLISRPVIPLGPDIGYLPGDIQEKLFSWMQPIYDNMDFISHTANVPSAIYREEEEHEDKYTYKKKKKKHPQSAIPPLDDLIASDKVNLDAITYMRGRSIPYQFILIDEVQNLTPHEVKTLISRVGEGSKIILAGDPYQIDSPYLDFSSNGLIVGTDKFKGQKLFGTVYLEISERSELSRLASELL